MMPRIWNWRCDGDSRWLPATRPSAKRPGAAASNSCCRCSAKDLPTVLHRRLPELWLGPELSAAAYGPPAQTSLTASELPSRRPAGG